MDIKSTQEPPRGCCGQQFSEDERRLIGAPEDGVMRLYLVDDPECLPVLRGVAKELDEDSIRSEEIRTLYLRMLATVTAPENDGVGIAAPQVGLPYRAVIVQRFDKDGEPFEFYLNPVITEYSDFTAEGREGCLSIPGYWGLVERSTSIKLIYVTPDGEKREEVVNDFTAVIFQHEIDHIDGILYTDRTDKIYREE